MTEKTAIVAHLGERAVLLPQLLSRALDANERAKLRMTLPLHTFGRFGSPCRSGATYRNVEERSDYISGRGPSGTPPAEAHSWSFAAVLG